MASLTCLFYTHLLHFKADFIKNISDSTPPCQQLSALVYPPSHQQSSSFGLPLQLLTQYAPQKKIQMTRRERLLEIGQAGRRAEEALSKK